MEELIKFKEPVEFTLPAFNPIPYRNESDAYGASYIAKLYTGVSTNKPIDGIWSHGCVPDFFGDHPIRFANAVKPADKTAKYFVARKSQEKFMHDGGYESVKAVGLPIIYVKKQEYFKIPGSLLVMPVHSTMHSEHEWNFKKYVEQIVPLQKFFSPILISLHGSCIKRGYWINEFEKKGFKVVQGLHGSGANDHFRLQKLMSLFEFVTTNGFGSHIAYAAYYGAKVSIYGDYPIYRRDDFKFDETHTACPQLLDNTYKLLAEENVRRHLGEFFCSPIDAVQRVEWAKKELGYENKVGPEEMRDLFGWSWGERKLYESKELMKKSYQLTSKMLPKPVKEQLKKALGYN
jgi:hypothetical protein